MQTTMKFAATFVVVLLIVLPLPPSTIIGLAIVANPRTNRYLDPTTIKVTQFIMKGIFFPFKISVVTLIAAKENSANQRIKTNKVRMM